MRTNRIVITKVVSKNIIWDTWSGVQNLLGRNLSAYENMVDKGVQQVEDELAEKKIELEWFRYEITQLTTGAIVVMLYGERKVKK